MQSIASQVDFFKIYQRTGFHSSWSSYIRYKLFSDNVKKGGCQNENSKYNKVKVCAIVFTGGCPEGHQRLFFLNGLITLSVAFYAAICANGCTRKI
ncbi:hypothetical protein ABXS71_05575 [Bacillus infantis]|uniref:hypothetical protein n=1 Tax=Bacillus infantis TaxID=324767 RepID=UPI00344FE46E